LVLAVLLKHKALTLFLIPSQVLVEGAAATALQMVDLVDLVEVAAPELMVLPEQLVKAMLVATDGCTQIIQALVALVVEQVLLV